MPAPLSHPPRLLAAMALAFGLAACQPAATPPTDAEILRAEARLPADAALAERYQRSCRVCHTVRGQAPLVGHAASWAPRVARGRDALLASVQAGLNGMPARGLCPDCSDEELRRLIDFLVEGR